MKIIDYMPYVSDGCYIEYDCSLLGMYAGKDAQPTGTRIVFTDSV